MDDFFSDTGSYFNDYSVGVPAGDPTVTPANSSGGFFDTLGSAVSGVASTAGTVVKSSPDWLAWLSGSPVATPTKTPTTTPAPAGFGFTTAAGKLSVVGIAALAIGGFVLFRAMK